MYSIGEFSQSTRLTVKTLRYYHDIGILVPAEIDGYTGYRYYDQDSLQKAYAIISLKDLSFSLKEIHSILKECKSDNELKSFIGKKLSEIKMKRAELDSLEAKIKAFQLQTLEQSDFNDPVRIEEFQFELPYYVSKSIVGKYSDIGIGFRSLFRNYGRYAQGNPYAFFYDMEYKENDAGMEAVIPLKSSVKNSLEEFKSGFVSAAVKLIHKGSYGAQGNIYAGLFKYCHEKGYTVKAPIVEHYLKGPGMVFKGNPDNYITECIALIESS